VNLAPTNLSAFLHGTIEPHREFAASKGVKIKTAEGSATSPSPPLDAEQMHRALDNLILNAIQNTPSGGTVKVEADSRDGWVSFRVHDTGPGIPESIRERLFEPFVTGRTDGTGLGLAIVREIARAHGGDVRATSNGSGATFDIIFPWRKS
jgi:signal transduction histidine kinase